MELGGNVGIGTASPKTKLHIDSTGPNYASVSGNDRFRISEYVSSNGNEFGLQIGHNQSTGNTSLQSYYYTSSSGAYANGYSILLQPYGGWVGIGADRPRASLHVGKHIPNNSGTNNTIPSSGMGQSANMPNSTRLWLANRFSSTEEDYWGCAIGVIWNGHTYIQSINKKTSSVYNILLNPNGGNVGIGTTDPQGSIHINTAANGEIIVGQLGSGQATAPVCIRDYGNEQIHFYYATTKVGSITSSSSSTAYNTSSDYRLKENVIPLVSALERVNDLHVYRFNFITDTEKTVDGFFAHEVQSVVPEAITGVKDETEDIGIITNIEDGKTIKSDVTEPTELKEGTEWTYTGSRPVYQSIDQSKLVPLLTKCIQELSAKNDALEARIAALENA